MPTILVLDRSPAVRAALARLLQWEGYRVLLADNAWRATRLLQTCPVDLVLLDPALPATQGQSFLRHLQDDARGRRLPVIVATAMSVEVEAYAAFRRNISAWLQKADYSGDQLLGEIERALSRGPSRPAWN